MGSIIKADTEGLWHLYTVIGNAREQAEQECIHMQKSLNALEERLHREQRDTEQKIDLCEGQIEQLLKSEKQDCGVEINALQQEIQQLQIHILSIQRSTHTLLEYMDRLSAQEKENQYVFRAGQKKVNQYLSFLEIMVAADDMEQSAPAQNQALGQYYVMSFRGVNFYCNDSQIDIHQEDSHGKNNLQRMQNGRPPMGKDGKPINLHHMQQSDRKGGMMELSKSTHEKNHRVLHVNTHDIPSGINRTDFEALKKAYWKKRAEMFLNKAKGENKNNESGSISISKPKDIR